MRLLVLRHETFEDLGLIGDTFQRAGVSWSYWDFSLDAGPSPAKNDAVVILGGPMSANDADPERAAELKLIETALANRTPMLGICLGAQLIAKALGARVYRNEQLEIGWEPVEFTDAGKADPLFRGIPSPAMFFHWHGETFDLPSGAEWLAFSKKTRHQAYRFGSNVYGLQFHPEVTSDMVADWQSQPVNCGDVATLAAPIDPYAQDQSAAADKIVTAWLASFSQRTSSQRTANI